MSVAGLPARGVRTKFLDSYIKREAKLQANAKNDPRRCTQGLNCLTSCGLRDGLAKAGQFCIDIQLSAAFRGEVDKGLFSAVKTRCRLAMPSVRFKKPFNIS